ncbi:transposase [Streptomyces zaomyceticus]|uniref:transposase n=1 Tax=Streptomyces zaomyceticus TaxID=68286 RepID=UPI003677A6C8
MGTVEACKQLGIGRKTGYRWRSENGGLPPERVSETVHSGRYLSLLERKRIATLREHGLRIREIAARLDRSPSTISRELRRNMLEHDQGLYDADLALHRSRQRGERPRRPKLRLDAELRAEVQAKLDLEWSPEQIAAHLRALWPERPNRRHLCHETIYRALYQGAKGVLIEGTHQEAPHRPAAAQAAPQGRPTRSAVRRSGDAHRRVGWTRGVTGR